MESTEAVDSPSDVRNLTSNQERWNAVLASYIAISVETPIPRNGSGKIYLDALIDVSDSMEGKKLIAVKLGLCSLISNLQDDDEVNITSFSHARTNITGGFSRVCDLRRNLPDYLVYLRENGSTACYDAIKESLGGLRTQQGVAHSAVCRSSAEDKYVCVCLTDGDDNCSRVNPAYIERYLCRPGVNNFMFVLVAVDMLPRQEARFRRWFDLRHCKQVSVNVHSGATLLSVLAETLLARVLSSEVSGPRFLQDGGEPQGDDDANVEVLRQDLLRQLDDAGIHRPIVDQDGGDDYTSYPVRMSSAAVSRVNSVDGDGPDDIFQRDRDVDMDLLGLLRSDDLSFIPIDGLDEDGFQRYDPSSFDDYVAPPQPSRSGTPIPESKISACLAEPNLEADEYPSEFYCPITVSIFVLYSKIVSICGF
jgi:hypothetical protein